MRRATLLLLAVMAPPGAAAQQELPSATPSSREPLLFESHEPITLTIRADFDELKGDREQEEEEREGTALVTSPGGETLALDLQIRTRGRFRLQRSTCSFPPLRLNFKKGQLDGTFLDGQDKVKLVTHCRDSDRYEQKVLKEYLVYRMFNQITDNSFRVRLARITYEDTSGGDPVTRWGFLIEDDDLLAERLGGTVLETVPLPAAQLVGRNTGPVTVFQYMVGNTDFSLTHDHNTKLVDLGTEIIPVPYDFDWTGFVDAPYAEPDPRLDILTVRQRVFRGLCRVDIDYPALYALFNARRDAILELIRTQEGLEEDEREDAVEYVEDFYETINDEDDARGRIERACRRG